RSTSSAPAFATAQIGSSVAGFMVWNTSPESASTDSPLMMSLAGFTGVRVSVMSQSSRWLDAAFEAPALDDVGMMAIVLGQVREHRTERMRLPPDIVGLLRDRFER